MNSDYDGPVGESPALPDDFDFGGRFTITGSPDDGERWTLRGRTGDIFADTDYRRDMSELRTLLGMPNPLLPNYGDPQRQPGKVFDTPERRRGIAVSWLNGRSVRYYLDGDGPTPEPHAVEVPIPPYADRGHVTTPGDYGLGGPPTPPALVGPKPAPLLHHYTPDHTLDDWPDVPNDQPIPTTANWSANGPAAQFRRASMGVPAFDHRLAAALRGESPHDDPDAARWYETVAAWAAWAIIATCIGIAIYVIVTVHQ